MKVYILEEFACGDSNILGVFASEQKAEERLQELGGYGCGMGCQRAITDYEVVDSNRLEFLHDCNLIMDFERRIIEFIQTERQKLIAELNDKLQPAKEDVK